MIIFLNLADQRWYRAQVLEIVDINKYLVSYIDYGNREHVVKNKLRNIPTEFLKLRRQSFECSLAGKFKYLK